MSSWLPLINSSSGGENQVQYSMPIQLSVRYTTIVAKATPKQHLKGRIGLYVQCRFSSLSGIQQPSSRVPFLLSAFSGKLIGFATVSCSLNSSTYYFCCDSLALYRLGFYSDLSSFYRHVGCKMSYSFSSTRHHIWL